ncbi:MAG: glycogen phosphorylase, partial [Lachnospiraceae bacterium]|nr:glycogen phosphorylase [Lachnospiraceae bacterium]
MIFFDKDTFKRSIQDNVKLFFRKKIGDASKSELFQAVAYAVKDQIIDEWIATHKAYEQQDAKILYYMSMEFLMGRALGNMLLNISEDQNVREALAELGI